MFRIPTLMPKTQVNLSHAEVKAVIVSDKSPVSENKISFGGIEAIRRLHLSVVEDAPNWNTVVESGRQNRAKHDPKLAEIRQSIQPDDLLTIIYTSGTTGMPKGVMLSHKNLVSNFIETSKLQPLDHRHKMLSFLPLCHIYERMMNYHCQYLGIGVYYAENMGTIADNLRN